jgi:hypothetical protein
MLRELPLLPVIVPPSEHFLSVNVSMHTNICVSMCIIHQDIEICKYIDIGIFVCLCVNIKVGVDFVIEKCAKKEGVRDGIPFQVSIIILHHPS